MAHDEAKAGVKGVAVKEIFGGGSAKHRQFIAREPDLMASKPALDDSRTEARDDED